MPYWIRIVACLALSTALSGCYPALHQAAKDGDTVTIKTLLDQGQKIDETYAMSGSTPLHFAVRYGHADAVRLLLDRGADIRRGDGNGYTPLELALSYDRFDVAQLLIDRGVDISTARHGRAGQAGRLWIARMMSKETGAGDVPKLPAQSAGQALSSASAFSDVDRVPVRSSAPRKNAYAIVIGIEQYREKLPKADFADRDAKLVGEYLTKVMGYPEENVVVRTNDKASMNDLAKYLESWLPNNVEKDGSVFIYYSGHGAPNTKTGDAYLVPYDGDPTFVEKTGYPLKKLYAQLESLPTKDITVVLDSCFSGAGGRSVIGKGLRPMGLSMEHSISAAGKAVVLAASSGDQVSSTYEEKGHGLLTYFFLKGLQGEGDLNKDGNIDMAELYEYVKPSVSRIARKQYNNEQTPQLLGSPDSLKKGGGRLLERTAQ